MRHFGMPPSKIFFRSMASRVELIYIPTALQVTRVVLTGDSQIAFSGGAPVVSAVLSGADLVFVGGFANVPAFYMMALPEIKSVADLKGKTVGVTRFGSSTDFALRYLMQKHGFNSDKDVTILQLGGMPELAAALSKRLIVAAPLSAPTHIRARAAGARLLARYGQSRSLFSPHRRHHQAGLFKNQPRNGVELFSGVFRRAGNDSFRTRLRRRKSSRSTLAIPPKISSKRPISTPSTTWSARRTPIARVSLKRLSKPKRANKKSRPGSVHRRQRSEGTRRSRIPPANREVEIGRSRVL